LAAFPNFDQAWAAQLAEYCADAYAGFLEIPDGDVTQVDYALAADPALDCACVTYALGAEADDVWRWVVRAAYLLDQVFALRGGTPPMPVSIVDASGEHHDVTPSGPDQSLTNSRRGLLAMQAALIAGDRALAEQIAELVGDPPDASYLGPDSVVCTPDDQALAYALKALLLGQIAVAVFHIGGVGESAPPILRRQAAALYTLIDQDQGGFLAALVGLIDAHAAEAAIPENAREPRRFLNLPALALARLALDAGLVRRDVLPESIYLPLSLLM
jgi:hypothetical protein